MQEHSSDSELVRRVRGSQSQTAFAEELGITQPVVSEYENGTIKPSADVWLKMARHTDAWADKVSCWERAGLDMHEREILIEAMRLENEPRSQDAQERLKIREAFRQAHVLPEDATGPLGDEPVGGEPESLKGPSKTVREFINRHSALSPLEPVFGERGVKFPAKKAKRQRRKK